MQTMEQQIRERACYLWQSHGGDGAAEQHWLAAEREVLSAATGAAMNTPPAKTARKAASRARKKAA